MLPSAAVMGMLEFWNLFVGLSASCGIVITAFDLMLHIIEVRDALRRIALITGYAILLTVLPSIILSMWSGISIWQKIGILILIGIGTFVLSSGKRRIRRGRANRH